MAKKVWGDGKTEFFYQLTPELVLDSIEELGFKTTGRCLPLNSMENRVYEIEIHLDTPATSASDNFKVAKFYRPGRWSKEQILEEHEYLNDLKNAEIPVIAPLKFNGETLFETKEGNLFFCLYDKKGGRNLDEADTEQIRWLGRLLGRMHSIGAGKASHHRINLNVQTYGHENLEFLLSNNLIPDLYKQGYESMCQQIFSLSEPLFKNIPAHRIHGDCHWGNLIWDEEKGPFFVDFDDMVNAPAVQDLWLILPGRDEDTKQKQEVFIESYNYWHDFPRSSLNLIEPLRTLRYIHFSAWIGKRWEDPAFKAAFPYYGSEEYWTSQINDLREQLMLIQQIPQYPDYY